MRVRKPKKESSVSESRLTDDGYNDGKAGRQPLDRQLFESPVDYQVYKQAYDKGVAENRQIPKRKSYPSSPASGIWVFILAVSSVVV